MLKNYLDINYNCLLHFIYVDSKEGHRIIEVDISVNRLGQNFANNQNNKISNIVAIPLTVFGRKVVRFDCEKCRSVKETQ